MTDRGLFEKALEALGLYAARSPDVSQTMDALRERLAQPERTWVGLTDEELEVLEIKHAPPVHPDVKDDDWWEFAQAIETKLREKNT